jgi:hypothetical protein
MSGFEHGERVTYVIEASYGPSHTSFGPHCVYIFAPRKDTRRPKRGQYHGFFFAGSIGEYYDPTRGSEYENTIGNPPAVWGHATIKAFRRGWIELENFEPENGVIPYDLAVALFRKYSPLVHVMARDYASGEFINVDEVLR